MGRARSVWNDAVGTQGMQEHEGLQTSPRTSPAPLPPCPPAYPTPTGQTGVHAYAVTIPTHCTSSSTLERKLFPVALPGVPSQLVSPGGFILLPTHLPVPRGQVEDEKSPPTTPDSSNGWNHPNPSCLCSWSFLSRQAPLPASAPNKRSDAILIITPLAKCLGLFYWLALS